MFRHWVVGVSSESDTGSLRVLPRVVPGMYSIDISRGRKSTSTGAEVELEVVVVPVDGIAARGVFFDDTWRR